MISSTIVSKGFGKISMEITYDTENQTKRFIRSRRFATAVQFVRIESYIFCCNFRTDHLLT